MTDYSKIPDYEINARVGESLGMTAHFIEHDGRVKFRDEKGRIQGTKDYCNNPSDAWPIIAENKINIDFRDSLKAGPMAKLSRGNGIYAVDKNPLRAAMIVFLMMKDAEKC